MARESCVACSTAWRIAAGSTECKTTYTRECCSWSAVVRLTGLLRAQLNTRGVSEMLELAQSAHVVHACRRDGSERGPHAWHVATISIGWVASRALAQGRSPQHPHSASSSRLKVVADAALPQLQLQSSYQTHTPPCGHRPACHGHNVCAIGRVTMLGLACCGALP